jgi:hypothetical protein
LTFVDHHPFSVPHYLFFVIPVSVMEKRKRTKNFTVHPPHHLVYTNIPASQPANNTTNIHTTHAMGIMQSMALLTHPFEAGRGHDTEPTNPDGLYQESR